MSQLKTSRKPRGGFTVKGPFGTDWGDRLSFGVSDVTVPSVRRGNTVGRVADVVITLRI